MRVFSSIGRRPFSSVCHFPQRLGADSHRDLLLKAATTGPWVAHAVIVLLPSPGSWPYEDLYLLVLEPHEREEVGLAISPYVVTSLGRPRAGRLLTYCGRSIPQRTGLAHGRTALPHFRGPLAPRVGWQCRAVRRP